MRSMSRVRTGSSPSHGGFDAFVALVGGHFTRFLPSDDLVAGRPPRPVAGFGAWARSFGDSYSDALLRP